MSITTLSPDFSFSVSDRIVEIVYRSYFKWRREHLTNPMPPQFLLLTENAVDFEQLVQPVMSLDAGKRNPVAQRVMLNNIDVEFVSFLVGRSMRCATHSVTTCTFEREDGSTIPLRGIAITSTVDLVASIPLITDTDSIVKTEPQ
jgi:hypothetical protein